jgi:hypothetical protein
LVHSAFENATEAPEFVCILVGETAVVVLALVWMVFVALGVPTEVVGVLDKRARFVAGFTLLLIAVMIVICALELALRSKFDEPMMRLLHLVLYTEFVYLFVSAVEKRQAGVTLFW